MKKRAKEYRDRRLIAKSGLFDEKYYLLTYPDVRKADIDPIKHYLKTGAKELRNPSPDFDTKYYLENNSDLEKSGVNPLVHYIRYGMYENRKINKSGKVIELNKRAIKNKLKKRKVDIFFKITKSIKNEPKLILNTVKNISQNGVRDTILKINEKLKGEVDISQKDSSKKLGSLNNFFNEVANIPTIKLNKPIDIIVPVYNGFEYLESLFKSIISSTTLSYRVLICDDKSSDERVLPFLKDIVSKNKNMELFENEENLGFIKTVNKLVEKTQNHFVILNTDTEVPSFWLERLMYPIFSMENIASTTPFTNAGTICSFPEYLKDNEILDGMGVDDLDSHFKTVNFKETYIEIPTGVGFCMGINKNLVNEIGFFDEIFGKGYAEENDWCQRAIQKGYKNIHVTNLFVYHKHGGSFTSEVKKTLLEKNLKLLNTKHQDYNIQVRKTVEENKLEDLRNLLFYKIKSFNTHTTLIFTHDLGGGTKFYTEQEIHRRLIEKENILLIKYNSKEKTYFIEIYNKNKKTSLYSYDENEVFDFLNLFNIDEIFVNSLVSYNGIDKTIDKIINLHKIKKSKIILPIHDFFPICPDFNLLGENSLYCNIPKDSSICHKCLSSKKEPVKKIYSRVDIKTWREQWQQLLNITDEIRCFSQSSKKIVKTVYPEFADLIIVKPHNIDGKYKNIYNPDLNSKPRVIGILGGIGTAKGSLVVKNMVEHIDKNKLDIKIVVIGNINQHINSPSFTFTGSYKSEELIKLVQEHNITEFFIPSVWPETFSYVTDEIMQLGYPLTVFDLGAPAERVKDYQYGNIIKVGEDVDFLYQDDEKEHDRKTIYIHIGANKTGSSSIQQFMDVNRDLFASKNLYYVNKDIVSHAHHPMAWVLQGSKGTIPNYKVNQMVWEDVVAEIKTTNYLNYLISSEFFITVKNIEQTNRIKKYFSEFNVKIILYIRPQDLWIESAYLQKVKTGIECGRFIDFIKNPDQEFDIEKLLRAWECSFGVDNIIIRNFDDKEVKKDLISDFINIFNFKYEDFKGIKHLPRVNDSITRELSELFLKYKDKLDDAGRNKIIFTYNQKIKNKNSLNTKYLDQESREEFLKKYQNSNEAIAKRYFKRDILFEKDDKKYEGVMEYTREEKDQIVKELTNRLGIGL